jgi:hypothetical protein
MILQGERMFPGMYGFSPVVSRLRRAASSFCPRNPAMQLCEIPPAPKDKEKWKSAAKSGNV